MHRVISLAIALLFAQPIAAQGTLRDADAARLDRFAQIAGTALLRAFSEAEPSEIEILRTALSGTPKVAIDPELEGEWSCRTLRLGTAKALTIYSPFKCTIQVGISDAVLEKYSGSERLKGLIQYREGRAIFIGIGHTADVIPPTYLELPADFRASDQIWTQVAVFERVSATRARLMFPSPRPNVAFDILELTR